MTEFATTPPPPLDPPPLDPPDPPAPEAPPPPPPPSPPGFDLGGILAAAFRDPAALHKFVFGSVAVLLIPFLGLGLLLLFGFMARTARNALEGAERPLAAWDDLGGLLLDGLRVLGVGLVWFVAVFAAGGLLFALAAMVGGIAETTHSVFAGIVTVLGFIVTFSFVAVLVALAHILLPTALIQMVAADQFAEAFRFDAIFDLIRNNLRISLYLLLTMLLIGILGDLSPLLCLVGFFPGMFWVFASYGVAMGHAGRLMGVAVKGG